MSTQIKIGEQARIKMIAGIIKVVLLFQLVSCSITEDIVLTEITEDTVTTQNKNFKDLIASGRTPTNLTGYDERSREIFSRYDGDVPLMVKYLKPDSSGDGSSFSNASGNLETVLREITNASASNVYVVLLSGGTYTPGTMEMKNHVAIVGGVDEDLGSDGVTVLDGRKKRVFYNFKNHLTNTALLYGVTITDGNAEEGGGMYNEDSSPSLVGVTFSGNSANQQGGGIYNSNSSPSLEGVTFSGNSANKQGGGIYNKNSSPSLEGVTFSGNLATNEGGGIYNEDSSPILVGVTFSGNIAEEGGGIHNENSSPILVGVTFSGNSADDGGGMYNQDNSSPILVGVTFSGNSAKDEGGGIYNDNDGSVGPLIINGIFWTNTSSTGPQFYFKNHSNNQENLRIYNSIVQGGTGTLTSGTTYTNLNQGGFGSGGSAPVVISFSNIIDKHPGLVELTDNGGSVLTHAITNSEAVDQGLYVRKSGEIFYYSEDYRDWYQEPDLSGTTVTPPVDADHLTATDATGHARDGRPDLGAFEAR